MYLKAGRKRDIAIQKNNLNEEVEHQQDCVLAARIIGNFLFSIEHVLIIILSSV
jgi:hypothetical protein